MAAIRVFKHHCFHRGVGVEWARNDRIQLPSPQQRLFCPWKDVEVRSQLIQLGQLVADKRVIWLTN